MLQGVSRMSDNVKVPAVTRPRVTEKHLTSCHPALDAGPSLVGRVPKCSAETRQINFPYCVGQDPCPNGRLRCDPDMSSYLLIKYSPSFAFLRIVLSG